MLKTTPFHARTAPLVRAQTLAALGRLPGRERVRAAPRPRVRRRPQLRGAVRRLAAAQVPRSRGRDAARLLDRMVTRDVTKCAVGQVLYTPWCDARRQGHRRRHDQPPRRAHVPPDERRAESALAGDERGRAGRARSRTSRSGRRRSRCKGRSSRTILQQLHRADLSALKYFRLVHTTIRDIPVTISRTGYTGDLGYEIWVDAERAVPLWDALIEAGTPYGITPGGHLGARHRAHRGRAHHARRRLLLGASRADRGSEVVAARDQPRLDGEPRQRPLQRPPRDLRAEQARGSAWAFVGIEVELESLERLYAERGLPPQLPTVAWRGERADLSRRRAGRLRDERLLVAAAQEVSRARARAGAALRAGHRRSRSRSRSSIGASAARRRVRKLPFFDPARKQSMTRGRTIRRHRHRRRPQRARRRRLSRARRKKDARARAAAARRRRRRHRRDLSRASSSRCSRTS